MSHIGFEYNDGGREAAGYKGNASDCVVRAIAIATEQEYAAVYDAVNHFVKTKERSSKRRRGRKSSARSGVYKSTTRRYMASLSGWTWVPTMMIGSGCRVHLRADELPPGRLVVSVSKHVTAVVDGVIYDTHDPSRDGTRCVYGYYKQDS